MGTCTTCQESWRDEDLNVDGVCSICIGIADPSRIPLVVFGHAATNSHDERSSLHVDSAALILTGLTKRKGKKMAIPIANIYDFDLSPPKWRSPGMIRIKTEDKSFSLFDFGSKFALTFLLANSSEFPYAQNIQKYIIEFQANPTVLNSTVAPCELDQIVKLKGLLDAGAITEEEFEAKKKQLLGL